MAKARYTGQGNVRLTLNYEEASTLAVILSHIGGSPIDSPRRHAKAVAEALASLGIEFDNVDEMELVDEHDGRGSITFKDYPPPTPPDAGWWSMTLIDELRPYPARAV